MRLSSEISSVHPVFHFSMLKKCLGDPVSIFIIEGLGVDEILSKEDPLQILDRNQIQEIPYT